LAERGILVVPPLQAWPFAAQNPLKLRMAVARGWQDAEACRYS